MQEGNVCTTVTVTTLPYLAVGMRLCDRDILGCSTDVQDTHPSCPALYPHAWCKDEEEKPSLQGCASTASDAQEEELVFSLINIAWCVVMPWEARYQGMEDMAKLSLLTHWKFTSTLHKTEL